MDMNKEVLERLDHLGGKFEGITAHGYESLVEYTVANGIIGIVSIILLLIITTILVTIILKSYTKAKNTGEETLIFEVKHNSCQTSVIGFFVTIITIMLVFITIILLAVSPMFIQMTVNPEGYLIKDVIDTLAK